MLPGAAHARCFLEPPDGEHAERPCEERIKNPSPHETVPGVCGGWRGPFPDEASDQREEKERISGDRRELRELVEPEFRLIGIEPLSIEVLPDEALEGKIERMRRIEEKPDEEPCRNEEPEEDFER